MSATARMPRWAKVPRPRRRLLAAWRRAVEARDRYGWALSVIEQTTAGTTGRIARAALGPAAAQEIERRMLDAMEGGT